jgi:alkane 1-monooxygenase
VTLRRLGFVLPLLLPLLVLYGHALGGAWNFLAPFVLFVVLPIVDRFAGVDEQTVAVRGATAPGWRVWFDGLLYAWVPIQLALIAWGAHAVAVERDVVAAAGLTLSIGLLTGGVGITVAHELGHRLGRVERSLACLLLASVSYAHFYIEHNKGHHARVATPDDPATAREGESFPAFLLRTVPAQFRSAWEIESARLLAAGQRVITPANRMLWVVAAPVAIAAALGATFGARAAAFFAIQSIVAFSLLELVNYVEHYGLRRRRLADGRYERVQPAHSWNASQRVSNWYLFNLQRHSHHHANVNRRYEELEHYAAAPQLPAGYAVMILVAMVPPLWRRVMDPRLHAWQAGQAEPGAA